MRRTRGTVTLFGTLLLALPGCGPSLPPSPATPPAGSAGAGAGATEAPEAVARLLGLMRDRLLLMHDVARSKWDARRPVSDPERERDLLRDMEARGREHGLDARLTRVFFAAQIEAAKRIQEDDMARWRAEKPGPSESPPDLAVLRGRIDGLNRQLLDALSRSGPWPLASPGRDRVQTWARQVLAGEGIDDSVRAAAIAPLITDP